MAQEQVMLYRNAAVPSKGTAGIKYTAIFAKSAESFKHFLEKYSNAPENREFCGMLPVSGPMQLQRAFPPEMRFPESGAFFHSLQYCAGNIGAIHQAGSSFSYFTGAKQPSGSGSPSMRPAGLSFYDDGFALMNDNGIRLIANLLAAEDLERQGIEFIIHNAENRCTPPPRSREEEERRRYNELPERKTLFDVLGKAGIQTPMQGKEDEQVPFGIFKQALHAGINYFVNLYKKDWEKIIG